MTESRVSIGATALALTLAALSMAAAAPAFVNHDAGWYLYVVERWFAGAGLYRDVIDTNPPLIVWLTAPSVAVSRMSGWPATAVFKGFIFALSAASIFALRSIVRRSWPEREFLMVATVAFVMLPFVKEDFGQREHLAVLLTMPYAVLAGARSGGIGSPQRALIGTAAGIGFAIKPHFVIAWVAVECVTFALDNWRTFRRTEFLAALAAVTTYVVAVVLFTPQYFRVVQQVQAVYGGLNSPPSVLVRLREVQLWIAALAVCVAIRWRRSDPLPLSLFAAATGYLLAALLQFKGWGYQLYPARVFLVLFLVIAAGAVLHEVPALGALLRGGRRGLAIVFAGALILASVRYIAEARRPAAPDLVTPMIHAVTEHGGGPLTVLSMRTIIYPAFPTVNYSRSGWGLRHNSLWFLPGFYSDQDRLAGGPLEPHSVIAMPALERVFFDQIVEDLCATPPQLLAIEQPAPAAPAGRRALDLHAYYGQNPRANALLASYRQRGTLGPFILLAADSPAACR